MKKKYSFTKERKTLLDGTVVHRIKALRDFGRVKKGELGGWIECEANLSHVGNAWVYDDALVYGSAKVYDNAQVYDNASVAGTASIFGDARVYGSAKVYGNAQVCIDAIVAGEAWVYGDAKVVDRARVSGSACVSDKVRVGGRARVSGSACVSDKARVTGEAQVYDGARVSGNAEICGNAAVKSLSDYVVFKNTWSSGRWFTYTTSNKMWKVGCFYGTGKELIAKAKKDSKLSGKCYGIIVKTVEDLEKAKLSNKAS